MNELIARLDLAIQFIPDPSSGPPCPRFTAPFLSSFMPPDFVSEGFWEARLPKQSFYALRRAIAHQQCEDLAVDDERAPARKAAPHTRLQRSKVVTHPVDRALGQFR